ncbi:hypothetical protein PIB30_115331, partial [Stylosanthes scabra]|nr:hypothetical protein [Stylosanthes scabra]
GQRPKKKKHFRDLGNIVPQTSARRSRKISFGGCSKTREVSSVSKARFANLSAVSRYAQDTNTQEGG